MAPVLRASAVSSLVSSQVASSGPLVATLHYAGHYYRPRGARLSIAWSGREIYSQPVHSTWCAAQCWPASFGASRALHVVRLQAGARPAVVLALYTGGAHCCFVDQVFTLSPTAHSVRKSEVNFGDPGARLAPIGPAATSEFVTADDSFAYAFTDFAASGLPVKILNFSNHGWRDVTDSFPSLISADAGKWQRAFRAAARHHYRDTVGVVAAWAADEDRLRHFAAVRQFLARETRAGHLNNAMDPALRSGRFAAALQRFLRGHGYSL